MTSLILPRFLLGFILLIAAVTGAFASTTIVWSDNSDNEQGFQIERARGTGSFAPLARVGPNVTRFTDGAVDKGQVYQYRVCAFNAAGRSAFSNVVRHTASDVAERLPEVEFQPIRDQWLAVNQSPTTVGLTLSGATDTSSDVVVVASSSNPDLIPHPEVTGSGLTSRLKLHPVRGRSGSATITVAVKHGHTITYRRFSATVSSLRADDSSPSIPAKRTKPPGSGLINASAFGRAGAGADSLVVGFTLTDQPTRVLLRAVGPTLGSLGVREAVAEPVLSLFAGPRILGQNQAWSGDRALAEATAATGAWPLAQSSRDAALLQTLPPGAYTAQVTAGRQSGTVLTEVYPLTSDWQPGGRMSSLAARVAINGRAGDLVLGFTVRGSTPLPVLIRAVGPSLQSHGVTGAVRNPQLVLYRGDEQLLTSDDWTLTPALLEAGYASGALPLTDTREAAALVTLPPGVYTVEITTADRRGGIVLAEVYDVP
jgi:hypothetical protein